MTEGDMVTTTGRCLAWWNGKGAQPKRHYKKVKAGTRGKIIEVVSPTKMVVEFWPGFRERLDVDRLRLVPPLVLLGEICQSPA